FVCIEGAWYYFDSYVLSISVFLLTVTLAAVWVAMYCMELATRMKLGTWWRNTVVYGVLSLLMLMLRGIGHGILTVVRGIPMAVDALILFIGISAIEFICLNWWSEDAGVVLAWFLEKLIFLPLLIYLVVILRRLQQGSKALAEGNLGYRVDDKGMFLGFKDHAANLNAIRNGMGIALEERMKSEHLKTELITNVSHDIKTPLTSIINYADLLGNTVMTTQPGQQLDKERVVEYTEVLLRQSRRMKKLLEDLVEVSKATTGNLEVTMTPCEIGVLLSQAVGEYEQRFEQQQLHLIVTQPDTPVQIMADGRHLWRIFDNLLNNICKYAQENSRVYVNVEADAGQVEITFRNMSKYVLNVTGKELEERFVRGDKSRHMEGSGLGLSIAKSLMDLQNGRMEIVTDGDLFKVILQFAQLQE
ncbi:MAG: HAMP domain-containing histidine kinase, partial [Lachnospiraceae bacterium]|nr:HAMP domain-containing histidine kinase [Lachnospiraceae bacterium]